jgi:hypothetical protein
MQKISVCVLCLFLTSCRSEPLKVIKDLIDGIEGVDRIAGHPHEAWQVFKFVGLVLLTFFVFVLLSLIPKPEAPRQIIETGRPTPRPRTPAEIKSDNRRIFFLRLVLAIVIAFFMWTFWNRLIKG